jgi:acyl carrier protein
MTYREALVNYIRANVNMDFDPDQDLLVQALDSVSLLQLLGFIDQELGVRLEFSALTLDAFATVDALLSLLDSYEGGQRSDAQALVAK